MNKILIASSSCGKGIGSDQLRELFNGYGLDPDIRRLKDCENLEAYEAILVGTETVDEKIIDEAVSCKVVMKYGVGTDNIDKEACARHGIRVESMPGINSDTVAEMALALMLAAGRNIPQSDRSVKAGGWDRPLGVSLIGKTLGIIGTGAIGRKLAGLVSGLDMKIIGYDVYQNEQFKQMGTYVGLDELCREADFISIHVPLNDSTYHLIGEKQLGMMKRNAILVNTARGGIVDEEALTKALDEHLIKAAALDVYEGEKPHKEKLLQTDGLITTPHIAAYAYDTMRRMDKTAAAKLAEVLNGQVKEDA